LGRFRFSFFAPEETYCTSAGSRVAIPRHNSVTFPANASVTLSLAGCGRVSIPLVLAMKMARVILFTPQIESMSKFYGDTLGLKVVSEEKGWREFAAGGATIALHSGPSSPGRKGPKIVFYAADVAATRDALVKRGANFGKVRGTGSLHLCDGKDPDGNPIQLSNR
jgi:catechol 2,3-dioxygenase-like lactoylglutathione lyase family enzyme